LRWDSYDGYDLQFLDGRKFIADPEWVSEWQEDEQSGAESLEYILDGLTDEVIEEIE
jgi:2,4-dienoyl-CoA reductase-like NADH-dependent reductase (Old Yellow Enzyme family)